MHPLFFILAISILPVWSIAQEPTWKLKKSTDGIEVYFRKAEDSPINEIRIKTVVSAPINSVLEVMRNFSRYREWIYKCTEANQLEQVSDREFIYYVVIDFPWPMNDRDFIARSKITRNPTTGVVNIEVKGLPDYKPDYKERVRIRVLHYRWTLTPEEDNVRIDYHLKSDPGGILPAWLINLGIDQGPTQTIRNLRSEAMRISAANSRKVTTTQH